MVPLPSFVKMIDLVGLTRNIDLRVDSWADCKLCAQLTLRAQVKTPLLDVVRARLFGPPEGRGHQISGVAIAARRRGLPSPEDQQK
jgi:hypothetical protein